jgi:hypothetical protein
VERGQYVLFVVHSLHGSIGLSVLCIPNKAKASAASSIAVLNHDLSRCEHSWIGATEMVKQRATHSFFDLAEFLELLAQSLVVGMPRKASVKGQLRRR